MREFIVFATMLSLASAAGAAQSPGQKCQTGKNQEAGKYAACVTKAEAKLLKTKGACSVTTTTVCYGDADCPTGEACSKDLTKYGAAVQKCADKFEAKWNKLEDKTVDKGDVCPDGLLHVDVQGVLDECVANVAAGLAGEGLGACGDGVVDAGEDCDQGNVNGGTCVSEGFAGGVLRCGSGCVYDASGCYAARFEDNGDGTIIDHETGLMWEKKVGFDSTVDLANLQDADNIYQWSGTCSVNTSKMCQPDALASAACFAGADGTPTGCDECTGGDGTCTVTPAGTIWQLLNDLNTANYGGYDDWRAPTLREQLSIIDYADGTVPCVDAAFDGVSCGGACSDVNDPACSCTHPILHWSASAHEVGPADALCVTPDSGFIGALRRDLSIAFRAVRGGS